MFVYLITNKINNKKYVGVTNNPQKRWNNHCHPSKEREQVISLAIQKYGEENFLFEVIEKNIPLDQIDEKEIYYIEHYNSSVKNGQGYNVADGGLYNMGEPLVGCKNGRSLLTEEEVKYIKSHRDIPQYVLYDKFSDKIHYSAFKNVYNHKTYKDIEPTVECYPYNLEFSGQFATTGKLTYPQVTELRKQFNNQVFWKDAYTEEYQKIYPNEMSFWNVYLGNRYKLVMPEVFTPENKKIQSTLSHSGTLNGRAKLTEKDVKWMREQFENKKKTRKELQDTFSQVSTTSINSVLSYKTWKYI